MTVSRRDFLGLAVTIGASLALGGTACKSRTKGRERRELYPEGVASGDPDPHSVILWTRRPFERGDRTVLGNLADLRTGRVGQEVHYAGIPRCPLGLPFPRMGV